MKNPPANAGDVGAIPGWGRYPVGGHGNLLQDSCLENPMDGGAWWAEVHGVAKSGTQLNNGAHARTHVHARTHTHTAARPLQRVRSKDLVSE